MNRPGTAPLRGGLAKVETGNGEVFACVIDRVDLGRVDVGRARRVADHSVLFEGRFPELVHDVHVLIGHVVALGRGELLNFAHVAGGCLGV
jgi:hypothetical protein